tara:strand:- start:585 stop:818 length:234 start_codon:yes stop_codon:yes gene_type:complete
MSHSPGVKTKPTIARIRRISKSTENKDRCKIAVTSLSNRYCSAVKRNYTAVLSLICMRQLELRSSRNEIAMNCLARM